MDLHISGGEPTAGEQAAIDAVLPAEALGARHWLLPALHAAQDRVGWVTRGALNHICRRLGVPPAEAWGVVTFYHLLSTTPSPQTMIHVCDDVACRVQGAERLCAALEARLGPETPHHTPAAGPADPGPAASDLALGPASGAWGRDGTSGAGPARSEATAGALGWRRSPCLGQCDAGSAALVVCAGAVPRRCVVAPTGGGEALVARAHAEAARAGAAGADTGEQRAPLGASGRIARADGRPRLLARVGRVDPWSLASYRDHGGYAALARATTLGPEAVIDALHRARLVGRGGAAFPTARKWEAARRQVAAQRYVIANADESEPGTFKDRVLMEGDPFALIEALTIAGLTIGATRGFLYLRGEYPEAEARLMHAMREAASHALLGANVAGTGHAFHLELRRGGGAYICGEETALAASIEGFRGEPRSKPPYPTTRGLFGAPTVTNNVETLVNVLEILVEGPEAWAAIGTLDSPGPRLWSVSGHVQQPGIYEMASGSTVRAVIAQAGGLREGRAVQAVLLGGAAGAFIGPQHLDLPLSADAVRAANVTLGSGVVLVLDDTAHVPDVVRRIGRFFREESCGQCVPCRVGTVRQLEWLERRDAAPLDFYPDLTAAMKDASICGLGQTATTAIESALALGLLPSRERS
jgi:NADH-quinone oxidoreductase subunit F